MKNQYFGDINDYRKYGLLRALQSTGDGSLLVAWMLTPDDGGRDERFRAYLDDPDTWAKYDPDLFVGLTGLLTVKETHFWAKEPLPREYEAWSRSNVNLTDNCGALLRCQAHQKSYASMTIRGLFTVCAQWRQ
jgi:hypothetical protein